MAQSHKLPTFAFSCQSTLVSIQRNDLFTVFESNLSNNSKVETFSFPSELGAQEQTNRTSLHANHHNLVMLNVHQGCCEYQFFSSLLVGFDEWNRTQISRLRSRRCNHYIGKLGKTLHILPFVVVRIGQIASANYLSSDFSLRSKPFSRDLVSSLFANSSFLRLLDFIASR